MKIEVLKKCEFCVNWGFKKCEFWKNRYFQNVISFFSTKYGFLPQCACRVRFEPRHFLTISGVRNFTQDFFLCDETRAWLCFGCKECAGFPRSGCQSPFFHTAPSIGGLFQTSFQTPPRSAYLTSLQKWNHFHSKNLTF